MNVIICLKPLKDKIMEINDEDLTPCENLPGLYLYEPKKPSEAVDKHLKAFTVFAEEFQGYDKELKQRIAYTICRFAKQLMRKAQNYA